MFVPERKKDKYREREQKKESMKVREKVITQLSFSHTVKLDHLFGVHLSHFLLFVHLSPHPFISVNITGKKNTIMDLQISPKNCLFSKHPKEM